MISSACKGKNKKKLEELSSIKDPVKFAFAVAKVEAQLKVTNKKRIPKPETTIKSSGGSASAVDSTLERLREEALKTGNMTKLHEYKRKQRNK